MKKEQFFLLGHSTRWRHQQLKILYLKPWPGASDFNTVKMLPATEGIYIPRGLLWEVFPRFEFVGSDTDGLIVLLQSLCIAFYHSYLCTAATSLTKGHPNWIPGLRRRCHPMVSPLDSGSSDPGWSPDRSFFVVKLEEASWRSLGLSHEEVIFDVDELFDIGDQNFISPREIFCEDWRPTHRKRAGNMYTVIWRGRSTWYPAGSFYFCLNGLGAVELPKNISFHHLKSWVGRNLRCSNRKPRTLHHTFPWWILWPKFLGPPDTNSTM